MTKKHGWLIGLTFLLLLTACGNPRIISMEEGTELTRVSFASDGNSFLLDDGYNRFAQMRALPGGKLIWQLEDLWDGWEVTTPAFSRDGSEVALPHGGSIYFYAVEDGSSLGEITWVMT